MEEAKDAVRTLIAWAGDDPDREGLIETPDRVARAYRETLPEIRVVGKLKEFSKYLTSSIDDDKQLMKQALRSQGYDQLLKTMETGLIGLPRNAFDLAARSETPMKRSAADNLEAALAGEIST